MTQDTSAFQKQMALDMAAVPDSYVRQVGLVESGLNPHAHAPTSSADGEFQFITSTWQGIMRDAPWLGLKEDGREDVAQATAAFRYMTVMNERQFVGVTGRQPNAGERYLMHFLGPATGARVAGCTSDEALELAIPNYAAVLRANPFMLDWNCGQLIQWAMKKMGYGATLPFTGHVADIPAKTTEDLNQAQLDKLKNQ